MSFLLWSDKLKNNRRKKYEQYSVRSRESERDFFISNAFALSKITLDPAGIAELLEEYARCLIKTASRLLQKVEPPQEMFRQRVKTRMIDFEDLLSGKVSMYSEALTITGLTKRYRDFI